MTNKTFYITYWASKHKKHITRKGKHDEKSRYGVAKNGTHDEKSRYGISKKGVFCAYLPNKLF